MKMIPLETLHRLHTVSRPHEVIDNKDIASLLEKNRFLSVGSTASDPLFNGTLYFVRITFNTPTGSFSINNNDIQTAINYSNRAVAPISHYASQYGLNGLGVSQGIIQFNVTLSAPS